MDKNELIEQRGAMIEQAKMALETHHKALGVVEYLDYLIGELEEKPDGTEDERPASDAESEDAASGVVADKPSGRKKPKS